MTKKKGEPVAALRQLFEHSADQYPSNIALVCEKESLSYQELEVKANQLAHYLIDQGITENKCVGIFLERSLDCYVAILAILKAGAAYIPIDVEYPDERVNYIFEDMPFHAVITSSLHYGRQGIHFPPAIVVDVIKDAISQQPGHRPADNVSQDDQLCYVIYTSGSTGKPKGVEITHRNICHYVSVASELYEIKTQDKIYQGFSLAFDASLEEVWMAFSNGATLVACISKDIRSGLGLIGFLDQHQITVFSTVPTLLSTLEGNLPHLRLLILGGEACNANLIKRWSRTGLRIVNTYGPTEATVIATYAECEADKPVTIGKPIPGYCVHILNEQLQALPDGHQGELCIGGIGLARGYVNRPELYSEKFIQSPLDGQQRLYRTGDLAKINAEGDILFLGRIDDQIKLRGFRIELNEIEEVIMTYPGMTQAVVSLCELDNPTLVAYLLINSEKTFDLNDFKQFLHQKLPIYMIPAAFEMVNHFPILPSGKVNRKALPKPTMVLPTGNYVPPQTALEKELTTVWEEEFKCPMISIKADFFYDLGGHSLLAAKIVSRLRKIKGMQHLSILDLYNNPTIKLLADKFKAINVYNKIDKERNRINKLEYSLCAIGQFFGCLFQYAIGAWQLLAVVVCYNWVSRIEASSSEIILAGLLLFLGLPIVSMAITILAKWMLVGRIKPGTYKLWGWFYLRWWLVQRLQKNVFCPKHLIGSPLINIYYRLLGAKIGKNCYIGTASVASLDTLSIGDNTSIGYDVRLLSYIVEDGWLKIGTINIGKNCFVGSRVVMSLDTVIHDNSTLDDMSMLPRHAEIPSNQFYCGSPACPSVAPEHHITQQTKTVDNSTTMNNFNYGVLHYLCLVFATVVNYGCYYPALQLVSYFYEQSSYLFAVFIAMPLGAIVYLGLNHISIIVCKKLFMSRFEPGTYPIKSLHYLRQWTVVKMLDNPAVLVMADSLYLPYFLRLLGAKLGTHVEMGEAPHLIPDLVTIQNDGFSASSVAFAWPNIYQGLIKFAPVNVGKKAFLGNYTYLPMGASLGDGGLLGCLSTMPPDNKAAESNTSWLGSPAVFLPKRELFTGFSDAQTHRPSKATYNARLAIEFVRIIAPTFFTLFALFNLVSLLNYSLATYSLSTTIMILPCAELLICCGIVGIIVGLKWGILGKLKPTTKPLWDIFIRKLDLIEYLYSYYINVYFNEIIVGTPFVSVFFRCLGAKIGKFVYIDTTQFAEFDLISIGDEACINDETLIDTHLYEDRIFKMSTIDIREGCNVGIGSIILYNTIMESGSTLGDLSLLMKGEVLPANTSWYGTPAQPVHPDLHEKIQPELKDAASKQPIILEAT